MYEYINSIVGKYIFFAKRTIFWLCVESVHRDPFSENGVYKYRHIHVRILWNLQVVIRIVLYVFSRFGEGTSNPFNDILTFATTLIMPEHFWLFCSGLAFFGGSRHIEPVTDDARWHHMTYDNGSYVTVGDTSKMCLFL